MKTFRVQPGPSLRGLAPSFAGKSHPETPKLQKEKAPREVGEVRQGWKLRRAYRKS